MSTTYTIGIDDVPTIGAQGQHLIPCAHRSCAHSLTSWTNRARAGLILWSDRQILHAVRPHTSAAASSSPDRPYSGSAAACWWRWPVCGLRAGEPRALLRQRSVADASAACGAAAFTSGDACDCVGVSCGRCRVGGAVGAWVVSGVCVCVAMCLGLCDELGDADPTLTWDQLASWSAPALSTLSVGAPLVCWTQAQIRILMRVAYSEHRRPAVRRAASAHMCNNAWATVGACEPRPAVHAARRIWIVVLWWIASPARVLCCARV